MDSRLNEYILSKKEAFASDLGRLVAVYSVRSAPTGSFPFGEGPAKALDTAAEILSPETVREEFRQMAYKTLEQYSTQDQHTAT